MKITLHTQMQDYGQMIDQIIIKCDGNAPAVKAEDFRFTNCCYDLSGIAPISGVKKLEVEGDTVTVTTDFFLFRLDFAIECVHPQLTVKVTKETVDEVQLHHEELFKAITENGVNYRLYEPNAYGKRPLVLFLHGGGGSGEDNITQLTDTIGAIKLAERCPDMYVMAPQAPAGGLSMDEMFAKMQAKGDPFKVILGSDPDNDPNDRGWNRDYLGRVADIIRKLIAEGKVDASRVYVLGMSMGGFGTIKMVSIAPDLFAACIPICPSMNGESYPILENFPDVPAYIASAYIDHQAGRHAYLLRAVQKLWDKGRRDIRYVLFTPEELAAYGIGTTPNLSMKDLYAELHNSWILVMHNEYCILDWMFSYRKA